MKKRDTLILIIIVVLGLFIRLFHVGSIPVALNRDEAALAYNALLLKETGKDEWGRSWPLALESFGDYKLPGYPLAVIGSFWLVDYDDTAVRLPSVLAGSLLVLLGYWWARALKVSVSGSLLVSFILAVLPIFWFYSRMAFEANLGLFLLVLSTGLLWFSAKNVLRSTTDSLAMVLALFAVFTYNTPLLLLPFIIISVPLIRGVKQVKEWLFAVVGLSVVGVVAGLVLLPLSAQKSGITIFSDETVWANSVAYRQQFSGLTQKIIGHRFVYFAQVIGRNLIATFSPQFMVFKGGSHPWHQLPNWGHLYWVVYGLGLFGLGLSLQKLGLRLVKVIGKGQFPQWVSQRLDAGWSNPIVLLLYLLIVSLIPSIITVDAPHATRSLLFFFVFVIFGVKLLETNLSPKITGKLVLVIAFVVVMEALHYGWLYFGQYPQRQGAFQPGFAEALNQVNQRFPTERVAIVDGGGYQYIVTAWYLKLPPDTFFKTVVKQQPDKIGFKYGEQVDRYHFVAQAADRRPEETVVIEWNNQDERWIVTYNGSQL